MDAVAGWPPSESSPAATAVAHAWIRAAIYRELESEAVRRREHVDALTAQLVTAAVLLGCVDELIDKAVGSLPKSSCPPKIR